jgi:hypothetical protein
MKIIFLFRERDSKIEWFSSIEPIVTVPGIAVEHREL